jgi:hypothetical protein
MRATVVAIISRAGGLLISAGGPANGAGAGGVISDYVAAFNGTSWSALSSGVDNTVRAYDSWAAYDHAGASAVYSLPSIRAGCAPGHVVHMLARVMIPNTPNHQVRYAAIEFPVWWRKGEEPK